MWHIYNAFVTPNDTSTHRCECDCGLYINEEHDWVGIGSNKMRCIACMLTVTGTVPGGSISSVGDETPDSLSTSGMPVERSEEET